MQYIFFSLEFDLHGVISVLYGRLDGLGVLQQAPRLQGGGRDRALASYGPVIRQNKLAAVWPNTICTSCNNRYPYWSIKCMFILHGISFFNYCITFQTTLAKVGFKQQLYNQYIKTEFMINQQTNRMCSSYSICKTFMACKMEREDYFHLKFLFSIMKER